MTPENSGIHLWSCDNPRWCPSTWQAAQWSNRGDVAGSVKDAHRKMPSGGAGLEPEGETGLSGGNLCG